jgi:hypothetical protein
MASDFDAGHYFGFLMRRHFVLNMFPFPLYTAKLISQFCNNRQKCFCALLFCLPNAATLLLSRQVLLYLLHRQSVVNIKKILNFLIGAANRPDSPVSAGCSATLVIQAVLYSAPIILALHCSCHFHLLFHSPVNRAALTGFKNIVTTR